MKELTPDQNDAVRRALAQARHTDPLPTDVAARLDHVLDGLRGERSEQPTVVFSLDARRRRRRATTMLVAAAAVVVGGFGIDAMVGHDALSTRSGDEASSVDRDGEKRDTLSEGAGSGANPTDSGSGGVGGLINAPSAPGPWPTYQGAHGAYALPPLPAIRRDFAELDARRVLLTSARAAKALAACVTPADGQSAILVRYADRPAAMLIHPPEGNEQLVDLYYCPIGHSGRLIRTIRLPAR